MRKPALLSLLTALTLVVCLAGIAQDRDRDSYRPHSSSAAAPPPAERIDINHATLAELLKVPGISSSWANRIVRFRPYRTKLDLVENGVLPAQVYGRVEPYIIAHRDPQ